MALGPFNPRTASLEETFAVLRLQIGYSSRTVFYQWRLVIGKDPEVLSGKCLPRMWGAQVQFPATHTQMIKCRKGKCSECSLALLLFSYNEHLTTYMTFIITFKDAFHVLRLLRLPFSPGPGQKTLPFDTSSHSVFVLTRTSVLSLLLFLTWPCVRSESKELRSVGQNMSGSGMFVDRSLGLSQSGT